MLPLLNYVQSDVPGARSEPNCKQLGSQTIQRLSAAPNRQIAILYGEVDSLIAKPLRFVNGNTHFQGSTAVLTGRASLAVRLNGVDQVLDSPRRLAFRLLRRFDLCLSESSVRVMRIIFPTTPGPRPL